MGIGKTPRALETFRMVPDRLWLHPDISPFAIRLWCCLCYHARDRGLCDQPDAALADELKVSIKTVQRGLFSLEHAHFVMRQMKGRTRVLHLRPEGNGQPIAEFQLRLVAG
jgi:hypothetical protein